MEVTKKSLDLAIEAAIDGNRLSDIGHAVQLLVEAEGFSVVRDLVGHGLGTELHEAPQIPNYGPPGKGPRLKPGMVADATLNVNFEGMPLVVPRTAIIDTGKRKVIWVKTSKKSYKAKTVLAGLESEGYVEIKSGLEEGEEVVIDGNFLLDAQAQLFGGYEDMKESKSTGHKH